MKTIYNNYFYDPKYYDNKDGAYIPLKASSKSGQNQLKIPPILKPDQETDSDIYYTLTARTGMTKFLGNSNTYTYGYCNQSFNGPAIIFKRGKKIHLTMKNRLNSPTAFHIHGIIASETGDCHSMVKPGETRTTSFVCQQPASTGWLHAHPCMVTGSQVWLGLACPLIVTDSDSQTLPVPHTYGVDDIPLILQDRKFHSDDQFDYLKDFDPDGTLGPTPVINGTVNAYYDVNTQKVRLRLLDGSNRREWRLHFDRNLQFTQIAGDGSYLPHPVTMTKLMMVSAERAEIVVDFGSFKPGQTVNLYSDDTPIMAFRIHNFKPNNTLVPDTLFTMPNLPVDPTAKINHVTLNSTDAMVKLNGKKFDPKRIDFVQLKDRVEYWDIFNDNNPAGNGMSMIHPFHIHGCQFQVVSRNGNQPNPNELGFKDTIAVSPGETVRIKVRFKCAGVMMVHCHIIEHEDGGMMGQLLVMDPNNPKQQFNLNEINMNDFSKKDQAVMNKINEGMSGMSM